MARNTEHRHWAATDTAQSVLVRIVLPILILAGIAFSGGEGCVEHDYLGDSPECNDPNPEPPRPVSTTDKLVFGAGSTAIVAFGVRSIRKEQRSDAKSL
jgi:hypothetical protein